MKQVLFKDSTVFDYQGMLKCDCSLGTRSWLGVGGKSDWLYQPKDITDLATFISNVDVTIPYFVLGAGSNLIVRDGGYRGLIIRLGSEFSNIRCKNNRVYAGAFSKDSQIAIAAARNEIDLTFLRTIPGTIGGAVRMNAGCYGSYLCDHLISATVVTRNGEVNCMAREELNFAYRSSNLPTDAIIVEVVLEGEKGRPEALLARVESYLEKRNLTQPTGVKTAGSTFRNPVGFSSTFDKNVDSDLLAWKLISQTGLRGARIGDAQVSPKHPNFLVNLGRATATQIENLGELVRREVYKQQGIILEWEVIRLGELVHPAMHEGFHKQ